MEASVKELRFDMLKMCWFMRGGVTYAEAVAMCPQEREIIGQARGDVLTVLGKSREEIEAAETTARASLDAEQSVLAAALVEKVLGRKVA